MDQNLRQSIQTNTFYYFLIVMVLTTISQLSTMLVIVFGNVTGKELLVAASVVGPTLIGAFGIIRLLTNFMVLIKDMDEKIATTNYGNSIIVSIAKGNIFGTQFHPEKSQKNGLKILENFLKWKL